jgi:thioesterase domain-containing protein
MNKALMLPEAQALISQVRSEIPLTAAMQVRVETYDGHALALRVPLQSNINDKGTAFAGSIAALANLCGWALLTLWVEERFGDCQVAIYRSEMAYRKPLKSDFSACCSLPAACMLEEVAGMLEVRGKAKINLDIELTGDDGTAVTMNAGYAMWLTPENTSQDAPDP